MTPGGMTRDDIINTLHTLDTVLNDRVEIWRLIVDEHRHVIKRIYCGSFFDKHCDSQNSEPYQEENT